MAARLNPRHQDMVRAKIQTSQLINRLQNHAFGKLELTDAQRDSAKFLISKSLSNPPEAQTITHDGELVFRWKS
jgi:hypothetical protein